MPYPDNRYPSDPLFPRPQSTKTTKENDLMDRDWYEVVCSYIEDATSGAMPTLLDGQILRGSALNEAEATYDITSHSDGTGAEITVDHSTGTDARIISTLYQAASIALPIASNYPIGKLLAVGSAVDGG